MIESEYLSQMQKFADFYAKNKDIAFPHVGYGGYSRRAYYPEDYYYGMARGTAQSWRELEDRTEDDLEDEEDPKPYDTPGICNSCPVANCNFSNLEMGVCNDCGINGEILVEFQLCEECVIDRCSECFRDMGDPPRVVKSQNDEVIAKHQPFLLT
jgi:hypothetical protein